MEVDGEVVGGEEVLEEEGYEGDEEEEEVEGEEGEEGTEEEVKA